MGSCLIPAYIAFISDDENKKFPLLLFISERAALHLSCALGHELLFIGISFDCYTVDYDSSGFRSILRMLVACGA